MTDPLHNAIVNAVTRIFDQEAAERDGVREEIKLKGTWWAGGEIWKLRRQVAALRNRAGE